MTRPSSPPPHHPIAETPGEIVGAWRSPVNLLVEQSYDGHASLHDDAVAESLGLRGGAIEGPTHLSQFEPYGALLWGDRFFERGCLSLHFQTICAEGDRARAHVTFSAVPSDQVTVWLEREDGASILSGTMSIGPRHGETELDRRRSATKAPETLHILDQLHVGQRSRSREPVVMGFDQRMGDLYPFTLRKKLDHITERVRWHSPDGGEDSPWGRPIVPFEMVSVLTQYTSKDGASGFAVRGPAVGLFLDLEVRMLAGPLFVDQPYVLEREIVGLSESRRTESYWTTTAVIDPATDTTVALATLHQGVFKESYAGYPR